MTRDDAETDQLTEDIPEEPLEDRGAAQDTSGLGTRDDSEDQVWCAGCGRTDDYTGHIAGHEDIKWQQCDECKYWHHCRCVGFWGPLYPTDWVCRRCMPRNSRTRLTSEEAPKVAKATALCSPFCTGCDGRGCTNGMPNLGTLAHKRIVQVKNAEAKGMEEIMRKPGLETGARVVWSPNPATAIPCVVLGNTSKTKAAVEMVVDGKTEHRVVSFDDLRQIPPEFTTAELEELASRYGCIWGGKQMRYELRMVRKAHPKKYPGRRKPAGIEEFAAAQLKQAAEDGMDISSAECGAKEDEEGKSEATDTTK